MFGGWHFNCLVWRSLESNESWKREFINLRRRRPQIHFVFDLSDKNDRVNV